MTKWQRTGGLLLVIMALIASPRMLYAQTVDDGGAWLAVFSRRNICHNGVESNFKWWFDGHARFFDDSDGFGQSIIRPGIGYALTDSATLWAGYGWIRTSPGASPHFDENRVWQQLTVSKTIEPVSLGFRSRLEQRFLETGSDTGWRFRQLVSARKPIPCTQGLTWVAWDEVFIHLNDTDWGADSGFDQNRLFLGIGWKRCPCSPWRVEIGYLNQYIDSFVGSDVRNHLISINFYRSP